jgi:hypothetical protein
LDHVDDLLHRERARRILASTWTETLYTCSGARTCFGAKRYGVATTFGFTNRHYTLSEVYVRDIQPSGFTRTQPRTPQQAKEDRYLQGTKPRTESLIPFAFGETYPIALHKELIKFFIREKMGIKGQIPDIFLAFGSDISLAQFTEVINEVPDASCSHSA